MEEAKWLSLTGAAKHLGVCYRTFVRDFQDRIPFVEIGLSNRRRYRVDALDEYMARLEVQPEPPKPVKPGSSDFGDCDPWLG